MLAAYFFPIVGSLSPGWEIAVRGLLWWPSGSAGLRSRVRYDAASARAPFEHFDVVMASGDVQQLSVAVC
ncbi:hypothetical protein GCM10010449_38770 [Streptomyces rectiviolaceus]|uniref:Uncharacterized protein n=1 Tax=Streptomyces rectiviolaceus TaxID=332591 RepID=A0ABP6MHY1_9ACTN